MKYYLTTPLYYVNSRPHIGHSYTNIACDALARFQRLYGKEVNFLTGTDEHGQKIDKAAQAAGMKPQEFTDQISGTFRDLWTALDISYDDFIRTTDPRHQKAVQHVWSALKDKKVGGQNVLYSHTYDGWYCVSCETFVTEGVTDPSGANLCPDCKRPVEKMKEDTYFFRMSVYQDRLISDIKEGRFRILPETRRNEVLGFLEHNKLTDLSVSRPKNRLAWGIPIPFDTEHVTYVWFDALINYVSAVGYGSDEARMKKWWPADVHVIGKDIIRHHAVIWPTLLYALELELPKLIFAHGWWVQGGEKMSKSRGNAVDPVEIVKTYGVDAYRYFLLNETPFGQDGTFSEEALALRFNTDLANEIGNLLQRSLTMCDKFFPGAVPAGVSSRCQSALRADAEALPAKLEPLMERLAFSEALAEIWALIKHANRFIEEKAPWKLAKEGKSAELEETIVTLLEVLRVLSQLVGPFMPSTGQAIWARLGQSGKASASYPLSKLWGWFQEGGTIDKGTPLFPRLETKK